MKPDGSDTLARAQAKAAERCDLCGVEGERHPEGECPSDAEALEKYRAEYCVDCDEKNADCRCEEFRRCIFHHSVPANQGFEIKAGFVCYGHSSEFDNAGS